MKAAVYVGAQQFEIKEVQTPKPGPKQILVQIRYSAVCGTDVHGFLYDVVEHGKILGHEYSGTVCEVGSEVEKWKVGERVVGGGGTPPTGVVAGPATTEARFNYRTMGFHNSKSGAYAEYILMEEWQPIAIPDDVSYEAAALCEPCSIAVHAVRLSNLKIGDSVGVIGAGPIGLFCIQVAKAAGASSVIVSEPVKTRREAALKVGADVVIDPTGEDVIKVMEIMTDGLGPDVVFECASAKDTLEQSLNVVKRDGEVVVVAIAWESTSVLPANWMAMEVSLKASFGARPIDWKVALSLISSGDVDIAPMVSETSFIRLQDIQTAFESLVNPQSQVQVVVKP